MLLAGEMKSKQRSTKGQISDAKVAATDADWPAMLSRGNHACLNSPTLIVTSTPAWKSMCAPTVQ
jgi:hypothetical protein